MSTSDSMDIGVGLGLIVIIAFSSIALGIFLPAQFSAVNSDSTLVIFQQSPGETVHVYRTLNATVTDVSQDNVTVLLEDTRLTDRQTVKINGSETESAVINGFTIDMMAEDIDPNTDVKMTYIYPNNYGLSDGIILILSILESFIMLSFAFAVLGLGAKAMGAV